jgi:hypothetical protein
VGFSKSKLSRINASLSQRTVIFDFLDVAKLNPTRPGPQPVIKDTAGNFIVGTTDNNNQALLRIAPNGSAAQVIFDFGPKNAAVTGIAQDSGGNFLTTDSQDDLTDITQAGFANGVLSFFPFFPTAIIPEP